MRLVTILLVTFFCMSSAAGAQEEAPGGPWIKVIYNNIVDDDRFEGEGGLSCVVEGLEKTILFDTGGDGKVLMRNMEKMGIEPGSIDMVILSHDHWDHTGGLESFLEENSDVMLFVPSSFSARFKDLAKEKKVKAVVDVKGPMELCAGAYTTGEMGEEIIEQSLVVATSRGAVVITGCAHPGIVDITKRAMDMTSAAPLLVMGGFHLVRHSASRILEITDQLKELGVVYCGASHCTGDDAIEGIKKVFGRRYVNTGAGAVIDAGALE